MPVQTLLDRLGHVKRTKTDQWQACCPAHADSDPSLAIKELHDGRILIHCYAGCSGGEVMTALGLSLSDLYPDGQKGDFHPNWHMREDRRKNDHERLVLAMADANRKAGKRLSKEDLERERSAWTKLRSQGAPME